MLSSPPLLPSGLNLKLKPPGVSGRRKLSAPLASRSGVRTMQRPAIKAKTGNIGTGQDSIVAEEVGAGELESRLLLIKSF